MAKTQDILFNVAGQSLYWDCPEGRPSAVASMQLFLATSGDNAAAEDALDAAAIESDPDTTFNDAAGESESNRTTCPLTSTAGVTVGRRYLATNAAGERDLVEVQGITANVSAQARAPLANAYIAGDAFVSPRISATVKAAWVTSSNKISDDLDPNAGYRLRVEYTVDGEVFVHQAGVNLVRYSATHTVTPADMRSFRAQWANILPTYHQEDGGARLLDEAYDELRYDLARAKVPAEMVRDQASIDRGVKLLAWANLTEGGDDDRIHISAVKKYQAFIDGMFRVTAVAAKATDTTGAGTTASVVSLLEK